MAYEPATAGEQVLHAKTLLSLDHYLELRGTRLSHVGTGMPSLVWLVLIVGAVLSIVITYCFSMRGIWAHVLLTVILSGFLSLLIFLVVMMDNPFRGEFAVAADAFELARTRMQAYAALVAH
jgi:hypothetical protein